ncbi:MerR family transcriptional regulator [Microbacterium sp. ZW T6_19]|uniref:MerR family transcriptional regulator n=1 Tax=Microbacterium sp. ZW T6_19 TaxID=3378082 RepID=UPI003854E823
MATADLIERMLAEPHASSASAIDALHTLLDDSTVEETSARLGIAEAAELLGQSPHTLRYYEREGLVHPARNSSGYREYSAPHLRRLVFLIRMRVSGMTMGDLRHYVQLVERGVETMPERRQMMIDQRDRISRQLEELTLALATTDYKIRSYDGAP